MEASGQRIYRRHEIPYVDYLMTYQNALIEEFLEFHDNWFNADEEVKGLVLARPGGRNIDYFLSDAYAWKSSWLRYEYTPGGQYHTNEENLPHFPTASKILSELEGQLGIVMYSILEANSVIDRHTGPENRTGEYLRIHLPLIVPKGDIFFEVNGEEIDWSEPFGFNNQYIHSAHNYSSQRRLVFLIDIRRSFLGLPPGSPFYSKEHLTCMAAVKPFVRKSIKMDEYSTCPEDDGTDKTANSY